ncbi:hypothetical protein NHQ30_004861 [Ciborinia camelliae]|nr:hypothetical protein NHQ30_004861 [Ciborinia camelliae]
MSEYNTEHPGVTQEHIQYLRDNPLDACRRENVLLLNQLTSLHHMHDLAQESLKKQADFIKQVKKERDVAFDEGENYAREKIEVAMGALRREKLEAEIKCKKLEEKEEETQKRLTEMERELKELRNGRRKGADDMSGVHGVHEKLTSLSREEKEKYEQELHEVKEKHEHELHEAKEKYEHELHEAKEKHEHELHEAKEKYEQELHGMKEIIWVNIRDLKEEDGNLSVQVSETPQAESENGQALIEQLHKLVAERDDIQQQLELVTENLMGPMPTRFTPKENTSERFTPEGSTPERTTPEENKERATSIPSASADSDNAIISPKKKLYAPSPLKQCSTPESDEDEDEYEGYQDEEDEKDEEFSDGDGVLKESIEKDEDDVSMEGRKESIEKDESSTSREDYRKNKEVWSQQLIGRIKELERRNMRLERYHDMTYATRAILSLSPVHFEALRERKESKRKEGMVLFNVMKKERDSLRKLNRNLVKQLKLLACLRRKSNEGTLEAQNFILNQNRYDAQEEATLTYKRLYDQAQTVVNNMIASGKDVDGQEVIELRKERDILKKRKEELEEEIDGPLGLREQLAFSVAEDTEDVGMATQLTRVKAELEWRTKERDTAMEESNVEECLNSMKELMDQVSHNLESDIIPSEEKDVQYKEMAKHYQKCLRELSDEKEKVKSLERFLEEKYMEYEDLAGEEHNDSLSARLARSLLELHQMKRKLMERTIQRNSLTKSAVSCLTTALRENGKLQKKISTLQRHPNRDPDRPITDVDLENEEEIENLQRTVDTLNKRLNNAKSEVDSAENRAQKSKLRLDSYVGLSSFRQTCHPRISTLREGRDIVPLPPHPTDQEVITHLRTQLKDTNEMLNFVCAKVDILMDAQGDFNTERLEVAERRLEECMDLVDGPLSQKEAWDNLKGLLAEAREVHKVKMREWKERDRERDLELENLEKLLKDSEERSLELTKLLHNVQEDMKNEGKLHATTAELEKWLGDSAKRIEGLEQERDKHKAEADGLENFLQASETHTTQLEEKLSKSEERIQDLIQENDSHKAEAERLDGLLKAEETKTAEFYRTLRDEEEEQYREEIERLHELLLFKEEEDEQFREEIERLHELLTTSEEKVAELLDMSLATSKRLSDLDAEVTRWKSAYGESIAETEKLQNKLSDLEAEIELLRIRNNQNAETQTEATISTGKETPESPLSPVPSPPIPSVPAPKKKEPKKKAPKKKAPKKKSQDSQYDPHKDSASESPDEELEKPKPAKPQPKPNISVRREVAHPAPSPSPTPSTRIKLKPKTHPPPPKKKVGRKESEEDDPLYRDEGGAESDEEIPVSEVVQESPVEEIQVEVEGPRRSRRTRNRSPVYVGEFIMTGPGRAQKRKAEGDEGGNVERGKKGRKKN